MTSPRQNKETAAPTHAGGVVYRLTNGKPEYLLVRPKRGQDEWVFPKGRIERGERCPQTAIREVEEETGVIAQIIAPLQTIEFQTNRHLVRAKFFLMQFAVQGVCMEKRETRWVAVETALTLLTHEQNRELLLSAEDERRKKRHSE